MVGEDGIAKAARLKAILMALATVAVTHGARHDALRDQQGAEQGGHDAGNRRHRSLVDEEERAHLVVSVGVPGMAPEGVDELRGLAEIIGGGGAR
jgi:hypothetical protein